jgi:hypothetical protein
MLIIMATTMNLHTNLPALQFSSALMTHHSSFALLLIPQQSLFPRTLHNPNAVKTLHLNTVKTLYPNTVKTYNLNAVKIRDLNTVKTLHPNTVKTLHPNAVKIRDLNGILASRALLIQLNPATTMTA